MLDGRQGRLAVTSDVVERLEKASDPGWLDSLVTLNHGGEERYMATLDIFHEVHCLVSPRYVSSFQSSFNLRMAEYAEESQPL